jgi:CO/xanthine dehydrogenase Mo-binding subunit
MADATGDTPLQVKVGPVEAPVSLEVHPAAGDLKPWDNESRLRRVKGRHPRQEAPLKVTGRAAYTYDVRLPGMLWAKMVRAPIPAGKIVRIDTAKAERLPGVKAVWTTEAQRVRFAGQDIAAVAAATQEIAEDAARLVEVQYEETPFVTDLEAGMDPHAPLVYGDGQPPAAPNAPRRGNVTGPIVPPPLGGARGGSRGDIAKGFAEAEVVQEGSYRVQVHTHAVLEAHGVVAQWEGNQLTVYASTQGVFMVRAGLAHALGLDRKNVRVHRDGSVELFHGKIGVAAHPDRQVSFREAAQKMPGEAITCLADRKRQFESFRPDLAATQFAEVEVDVETGRIRILKMVAVNNCGIAINPLTAESQVIGAQIQGASWALYEQRTLDRNVGTMVNPNLESYKIFGPADRFEAVPILTDGANAGNNTSVTGIAEPVFVPTLAAIANAVSNATGVRFRRLPMTPDRVLAALAEAGGGRP